MQWNETELNETQIAARLNCINKPTIQESPPQIKLFQLFQHMLRPSMIMIIRQVLQNILRLSL